MDVERHEDAAGSSPACADRERVIIELNAALERDLEELFEAPEAA
jgi:hypothetical protein